MTQNPSIYLQKPLKTLKTINNPPPLRLLKKKYHGRYFIIVDFYALWAIFAVGLVHGRGTISNFLLHPINIIIGDQDIHFNFWIISLINTNILITEIK